ncbi:uridylyltransferase [Clostridium sp. CAG:306]|nr:uridylyltransferase [Clostridium sp. CAG:306]
MNKYDIAQKTDITSFFGFAIEQGPLYLTLRGYPSVSNLIEEDFSSSARVFRYVKEFVEENEITINDRPQLTKQMNAIIKALPEFLTLIGKVQHHTHSYCVAVHTLKVLQGVMSHADYQKLPNEDKRNLQLAVLMHDITKKEGEIDKTHPVCSAKDAGFILNKFDMPKAQKDDICLLIRNHDWLERYNKGITSTEEFAKTLKNGNDFLMLCILAQADLKAVQRDGLFYEKYKDVLQKGAIEINEIIHSLVTAA